MSNTETEINKFMRGLKKRNPYEVEFHQAVENIVENIMPWYLDQKDMRQAQILERLTEPDRVISFRVPWEKDNGEIRVNRGYRVQFNNTLGPYKGGTRFHPSVATDTLKFLGFEQIFKNSLTGLSMGGAKGGANFLPKGRSETEIMRFCQSYMNELYHYIGEHIDIPAGDIGVGAREIGYLFGHYKRIKNVWNGVMTGKNSLFGGSAIRKEATGFGCVYFCENMLNSIDEGLTDKKVVISGSGNVAIYTAKKAIELGAIVHTMSDSDGFIYSEDGLDIEQLEFIIDLKENQHGRIREVSDKFKDIEYQEGKKPWGVACDIVFPCATQNELDKDDAKTLIQNNVKIVCEGANMPLTADAEKLLKHHEVMHAPGKASNAGGVAVSGFERSQNAIHIDWSEEKVDCELKNVMKEIHNKCTEYGKSKSFINYTKGADLAAFEKVSQAMLSHGIS